MEETELRIFKLKICFKRNLQRSPKWLFVLPYLESTTDMAIASGGIKPPLFLNESETARTACIFWLRILFPLE